MENHPIPQDITGFQFKLIGDMTVKQFAYLGAGVVVGWILFILPIAVFIKLPLAGLSIFAGVGFAFLPIEGRPMDLMISNFAKAIFSPTQFIYQKTGGHLWIPVEKNILPATQSQSQAQNLSGEDLKAYLNSLPKRQKNELDRKEMVFFESLANISNSHASSPALPQTMPAHAFANQVPKKKDVQKLAEIVSEETPARKENELVKQSVLLQQQLSQAKALEKAKADSEGYQQAHQKVIELEKMLNDTSAQKLELEKQIQELQKRLTTGKQEVFTPSVGLEPKKETQNVRTISQSMGKSVGLPIAPEFPNLITGIVKDPRGNPLGNILIEVKDQDGNPVRAFKTNPLGQFASATPINNGTYTIEFEDTKAENKFDVIQFSATGQIIPPLEVISVDTREELRRSLFN